MLLISMVGYALPVRSVRIMYSVSYKEMVNG